MIGDETDRELLLEVHPELADDPVEIERILALPETRTALEIYRFDVDRARTLQRHADQLLRNAFKKGSAS